MKHIATYRGYTIYADENNSFSVGRGGFLQVQKASAWDCMDWIDQDLKRKQ